MSFSKPLPCHAEEEASVIEWIEANADQFLPRKRDGPPLRKRTKSTKIDYWSTGWGRMLRNPALENPQSAEAKQFKLRFRVPYLLFKLYLLPMCTEKEIFPRKANWRHKIPAEFKLLVSLRIFGRGTCADDIAEMSGCRNSTISVIFKDFVADFAYNFEADFIKFHTGERKQQMDELYALMGAPGNIGSMDATHSPRLNKCPKELKHLCTGKEGYPTLAWMCVVDHFRYI